jgi:DNA-binding XRE family transcriptional regulator
MMSKAELARKAGLSTLTIDRVEAGRPCRLDTKRKILLALGLKVSDKDRIFGLAADIPAAAAHVGNPNTYSSESPSSPVHAATTSMAEPVAIVGSAGTGNGSDAGKGDLTR